MKFTYPEREEGIAKEEGQREHQHNTPGPERANPGKARKKKEKRRPTDNGEGGEGRKRLNQPNTAKTYAYLGTRRTKPTRTVREGVTLLLKPKDSLSNRLSNHCRL